MGQFRQLYWDELNQAITVKSVDGTYTLTAQTVLRMEYKGLREFESVSIPDRPTSLLPELSFSRFPLRIIALLSISQQSGARAILGLYAFRNDKRYYLSELPRGDQLVQCKCWYPLVPEELEEVRELLRSIQAEKSGVISMRQCMMLLSTNSTLVEFEEIDGPLEDDGIDDDANPLPSEGLLDSLVKAKLYPYQRAGVSWLNDIAREQFGCILADEMGLGKTLQIIALIALWHDGWGAPSLVVAPATLLENWRREFDRFSPHLTVLIHSGAGRTGFPSELKRWDVIVTSYDTVTRDQAMLGVISWGCVVLDEAQAIKNPDTLRAQGVKSLTRTVSIAVTGTPVENRLRDIWSIMDFACPGLMGDSADLVNDLEQEQTGARYVERLVSPLMLRRRVSDVATDLPSIIKVPQPLVLSVAEELEYEEVRSDIIDSYGNSATLVALTKLRQFCCHPNLLGIGISSAPTECSTKYQRLLELLQQIGAQQEKAIIFTSYQEMANILLRDMSQRTGMRAYCIDGRTPVAQRQPIVDAFSALTHNAFLILNPRAAGTGLNITAANHVIHYNLEWNPAVEDQATARAYRRGQERPVFVYRLYYVDTLEEVINERLTRKRELAEQAVVGTQPDMDDRADIAAALAVSPIVRRKEMLSR